MAPATNDKLRLLGGTMLLCGGVVVLLGLAYFYLSPKTYQANTRLRVVDWVKSKDLEKATDERVVFVECDLIRSNVVVDPVIQNLQLRETWGKRTPQGAPLSLDDTRARFQMIVSVNPVPHSSIIEIHVASENPDETAKIANALAQSYLDYRRVIHDQLIRDKLALLKKQWDTQNDKIRDAQAVVDTLYFEITRERSTNQTQYYDPDAYDLLVARRAELQAKFVDQRSEMARFKKMDREQLKNVLSVMDTNAVFAPTLAKLAGARSDLLKVRLDHADDSKEVRNAQVVVDKLNEQVGHEIDAAMVTRETELASMQTMLAQLDGRIKNASTNAVKPTIKDGKYQQAVHDLNQLKDERENLQKNMDDVESKDAIKPTGVTADIIEPAEMPVRPYIPDPKVAGVVIGAGTLGGAVGCGMLMFSRRRKAPVQSISLHR